MNKVLLKWALVAKNINKDLEIGYSLSSYDEDLLKIIRDILDKVHK